MALFPLSDLPYEIIQKIIKLLPSNTIRSIWIPYFILNSKLAIAISLNCIHRVISFVNSPSINIKYHFGKKFEINSLKFSHNFELSNKSSRTFFSIVRFLRRQTLKVNLNQINFYYIIYNFDAYLNFLNLVHWLSLYLGKAFLGCSHIHFFFNDSVDLNRIIDDLNSNFNTLPDLHLIVDKLNDYYWTLSDSKITELTLIRCKYGLPNVFQNSLKSLNIISTTPDCSIFLDINNLPINLERLTIGERIIIIGDPIKLPKLSILSSNINGYMESFKIHDFIRMNGQNLTFLKVKNIDLLDTDLVLLKNLKILKLFNCSISFDKLEFLENLQLLQLIHCKNSFNLVIKLPSNLQQLIIYPEKDNRSSN